VASTYLLVKEARALGQCSHHGVRRWQHDLVAVKSQEESQEDVRLKLFSRTKRPS
jgi:hypothetical protein